MTTEGEEGTHGGGEGVQVQAQAVQEKLIKFATRIPAFMYLTDFRENTLQDVITKLEPDLFLAVTGLTVDDFHLLVRLKVFNTEHMNQAVFAFRRYEDSSLSLHRHRQPPWSDTRWALRHGCCSGGLDRTGSGSEPLKSAVPPLPFGPSASALPLNDADTDHKRDLRLR